MPRAAVSFALLALLATAACRNSHDVPERARARVVLSGSPSGVRPDGATPSKLTIGTDDGVWERELGPQDDPARLVREAATALDVLGLEAREAGDGVLELELDRRDGWVAACTDGSLEMTSTFEVLDEPE